MDLQPGRRRRYGVRYRKSSVFRVVVDPFSSIGERLRHGGLNQVLDPSFVSLLSCLCCRGIGAHDRMTEHISAWIEGAVVVFIRFCLGICINRDVRGDFCPGLR